MKVDLTRRGCERQHLQQEREKQTDSEREGKTSEFRISVEPGKSISSPFESEHFCLFFSRLFSFLEENPTFHVCKEVQEVFQARRKWRTKHSRKVKKNSKVENGVESKGERKEGRNKERKSNRVPF